MEEQIKKSDLLTHAVCILLVVYSIFRTYGIAGIRIPEIVGYILILIYLLKNRLKNMSMPIMLKRYFVFWLISIVLSATWTGLNGLRPLLGLAHTFLLFSMFYDKTNINILIRYYRYVALVCVAFFYMQEIAYYTTGIRMPGLIPGLQVMSEFESGTELAHAMQISERSSSFFSEPAIFVQFLLPLLCIELFYANDKRHMIRSGVLVLTLLLLQSGNAMMGLAAVFIVYLYKSLTGRNLGRNIALTAFTIVVSFAAINYYLQSDKGLALLDRQDQLSMTDYESGRSGFVRIYRGYFVYDNLKPIEKIIGVNDYETVRQRIKTSKVGFMFDEKDSYFNVVQDILIRTGIVGALFFLIFFYNLIKRSSYVSKSLTICLITLCFISAIYLKPMMAVFLVASEKLKSIEYEQ